MESHKSAAESEPSNIVDHLFPMPESKDTKKLFSFPIQPEPELLQSTYSDLSEEEFKKINESCHLSQEDEVIIRAGYHNTNSIDSDKSAM